MEEEEDRLLLRAAPAPMTLAPMILAPMILGPMTLTRMTRTRTAPAPAPLIPAAGQRLAFPSWSGS